MGLTERLPSAVLTLEGQTERAYAQLEAQPSDLAKNVYLEQLPDRNEVLYWPPNSSCSCSPWSSGWPPGHIPRASARWPFWRWCRLRTAARASGPCASTRPPATSPVR
jgi:hypothetical protein